MNKRKSNISLCFFIFIFLYCSQLVSTLGHCQEKIWRKVRSNIPIRLIIFFHNIHTHTHTHTHIYIYIYIYIRVYVRVCVYFSNSGLYDRPTGLEKKKIKRTNLKLINKIYASLLAVSCLLNHLAISSSPDYWADMKFMLPIHVSTSNYWKKQSFVDLFFITGKVGGYSRERPEGSLLDNYYKRFWVGCYSFPWIALLYPSSVPNNAEC